MSTRVTCSQCHQEIPEADVNVTEGVAYCRKCGTLSRLADLLDDAEFSIPEVDTSIPPRGCVMRETGLWTTIRASARSVGGGCGLLFAALFWNGIVSIFVLIALGGTIYHLFGGIPAWFPAPFSQGSNTGSSMPLGMVIFLWVFLLPFIAIGLLLIGSLLTTTLGRVEVRVRQSEGVAFTGFGPIGWRRRFDASDVKSVGLGKTTWKENNRSKPVIVIETNNGRILRLGSILPEERRAWMAKALRELLIA